MSIATLIFWFILGRAYVKVWRYLPGVLIGNAVGFLSLLIYLWQFLLFGDDQRSLFLAGLSQMFSASTSDLMTARIAILFEPSPTAITQVSFTAMQILGLLVMILIFTAGYIEGAIKERRNAAKTDTTQTTSI